VASLIELHAGDGALAAAGWLHDALEDTKVTEQDIRAAFNSELLVQWVKEVTDVSRPADGNRAARKALDREHLANASLGGKTVKLADLISNTRSIVQHDPDFARVYLAEKEALLPLLLGGNGALHALATKELQIAQARLVQTALERSETR
jgi:(p)ppGpp synthase/HD superfamily hydrolase